jgi:hypothetical protein
MERIKCDVKFIRIVPIETQRYPYLIWVSIGKHTHPPPAVNKTPKEIQIGLLDVIRRINDPGLTRSKYSIMHLEQFVNVFGIY